MIIGQDIALVGIKGKMWSI